MLVLTRKTDEAFVIEVGGETVKIVYLGQSRPEIARFGFIAEPHVQIHREEVYLERQQEAATAQQALFGTVPAEP